MTFDKLYIWLDISHQAWWMAWGYSWVAIGNWSVCSHMPSTDAGLLFQLHFERSQNWYLSAWTPWYQQIVYFWIGWSPDSCFSGEDEIQSIGKEACGVLPLSWNTCELTEENFGDLVLLMEHTQRREDICLGLRCPIQHVFWSEARGLNATSMHLVLCFHRRFHNWELLIWLFTITPHTHREGKCIDRILVETRKIVNTKHLEFQKLKKMLWDHLPSWVLHP